MMKNWLKNFMTISLFCLRQHFPVMTSLLFMQNFGNYSFFYYYWTVKKLWFHYHSFSANINSFFHDYSNFYWKTFFSLIFESLIPSIISISIPNTSNGVQWGSMGLNDATWCTFLKSIKNCWRQQKYHMKDYQTHNFSKQQHKSFQMWGYSSKLDKWFKN